MRSLRVALLVGAALGAVAGCHRGSHPYLPPCRGNSDCKPSEVCFADGCGDPGRNVVVEVTPASTDQAYPQAFALDTVAAQEDFQLTGPSVLQGNLLQVPSGGGKALPYGGSVSFTATGQSDLLPGLPRRFESNQVPLKGTYSFQLAEGTYSLIAYPADPSIPPLLERQVTLSGGQLLPYDFVFPAATDTVTLRGELITGAGPGVALPAMAIQALTPEQLPLSQRVTLDGGSFELHLAPGAGDHNPVILVFTPRDSQAVVPQKSFTLPPRSAGPDGGLYVLGDYGPPTTLSGRLVDALGQPVPSAVVHAEGTVQGGGRFQSASVQTDGAGSFTLTSLASDVDAGFELIAVPPPSAGAGLLEQPVQVSSGGSSLGDIHCPSRVAVTGSVTLPDGVTPAVGVTVAASPLAQVADGGTVPPQGATTTTGPTGTFTLRLDPAVYRFDFDLDAALPTVSSFGVVDGTQPSLGLPPTVLLKGRRVEGTVSSNPLASHANLSPAQALVRFYRRVEGPSGLPPTVLGQTYTDAQGHYVLTIPTR